MKIKKIPIGIYIHIPFCLSKCRYCDFKSYNYDKDLLKLFFKKIKLEINYRLKELNLNKYELISIYFGGGTPNLLPLNYIEEILKIIFNYFSLKKDIEITMELNPAISEFNYYKSLYSLGINRLSIGIQSFNNEVLKFLGRINLFKDNLNILNDIFSIGFKNISIDLIYGFFIEPWELFLNNLKLALKFPLKHISLYALTLNKKKFLYDFVLDDMDFSKIYYNSIEFLKTFNFFQYEISNFSKKSYESKHNLLYWKYFPYIGFGPSAFSFMPPYRIENKSFIDYILNKDKKFFKEVIKLSFKEMISEAIIMNFRLIEGIKIHEFNQRWKIDIYNYFRDEIENLLKLNYIISKKGFLKLNKNYLFISNEILLNFV